MSRAEFHRWQAYYSLFPFDDLHRFYRPAVVIAGAMSGDQEVMRERLLFLQPDPKLAHLSEADRRTFGAFPGATVRPAPTKPRRGKQKD